MILTLIAIAVVAWIVIHFLFFHVTARYRMTVYVQHEGQEFVGTGVNQVTYGINPTPAGIRVGSDFTLKRLDAAPIRVKINENTDLIFPSGRGSGCDGVWSERVDRMTGMLRERFTDWSCDNVVYTQQVLELKKVGDGYETRLVPSDEFDFRVAIEKTNDDLEFSTWHLTEIRAFSYQEDKNLTFSGEGFNFQ